MTRLEVERLRQHPELVSLLGLAGQLDLLPVALAAVHEAEHRGALAEQARSMSRVSQVLADQVRAYLGMIEEEIVDKRRCR